MHMNLIFMTKPENEKVLGYLPGSKEREEIKSTLEQLRSTEKEIMPVIMGSKIPTGNVKHINPPHDLQHKLGIYHQGDKKLVERAIDAATHAKTGWMELSFEERGSIFLKAADLLSGPYRAKMNAATMLCQSKNVYQAEIDAACELADFFRFNVYFANQIYQIQPDSMPQIRNRMVWRPLEGFIFALTPFNFTSIAGNLPTSPAIMGNTVIWKPSKTQVYSAAVIMEVLEKAGLPDGVINMVLASGPDTAETVLNHKAFAGIHYTGSTAVFQNIWKTIGHNIHHYSTYPRIIGETGGKDFIIVHESADISETITALVRGAFGYQGQKCSAASRAYIPQNLWQMMKDELVATVESIKMGPVEDFRNFMNAVIDEEAFDRLAGAIEKIKSSPDAEILVGGEYDKDDGYFIEPTVAITTNPHYFSMKEELFGPVLTIYIYDENKFTETLELCDKTSIYALTGAILAQDRKAIMKAEETLRYTAGNFYINDKPTGAVVNQQPFGGSRGSGTNDKAGSMLNLLRWVSPQSVKENFVPPRDYRYPFMDEK